VAILTKHQKVVRDKEMRNLSKQVFSVIDSDEGQLRLIALLRQSREGKVCRGVFWRNGPQVQVKLDFEHPVRVNRTQVKSALESYLHGEHGSARLLTAVLSELDDEKFSRSPLYHPMFDSLQTEIVVLAYSPQSRRKLPSAEYARFGRIFLGGSFEFKRYLADFVCAPNEIVTPKFIAEMKTIANEKYLPQVLIRQKDAPEIDLTRKGPVKNINVAFHYFHPERSGIPDKIECYNLQTYLSSQEWPQLHLIEGGKK
tara:strand:+ start:3229 stop:3996 length:768 start_codon:yes stop_codon:yes gene_type:complete